MNRRDPRVEFPVATALSKERRRLAAIEIETRAKGLVDETLRGCAANRRPAMMRAIIAHATHALIDFDGALGVVSHLAALQGRLTPDLPRMERPRRKRAVA